MFQFLTSLFDKNAREINKLTPIVNQINKIEQTLQSKEDNDLLAMTREWQNHLHRYLPLDLPRTSLLEKESPEQICQYAQNLQKRFDSLRDEFSHLPATVLSTVDNLEEARQDFAAIEPQFPKIREQYLNQILPTAFAVVKNAARRLCGRSFEVCEQSMTWDMVHFDTQLLGGIALHRGYIAEMATGEGKTLVSTLPVYLNALTGLGVHIVTVNDYLAQRDSQWMGALYSFLGLTVGCIKAQMPDTERKQQYLCDITYGTNSEFGFDYLRDNGIATSLDEQVQRGHYFAIIDEIDSILIDEARTPLIISGAAPAGDGESFLAVKKDIERLHKQQTQLCNQLIAEAQKALKANDIKAAGRLLFKVKLGQPRNRMLMRLLENPDLLRLLEKTENHFYRGASKQRLINLKEELYFVVDRKRRETELMEKGRQFLAPNNLSAFVLPDFDKLAQESPQPGESRSQQLMRIREEISQKGTYLHAINQMLKAYCLFERDVDYVIRDNEVVIVDEHTGREMPGRRWSDGLHQAVTAKEGLQVEQDNLTYATITIQNYFRMYQKLAGMTGTAETEAAEFHDIYNLDVLPIPTHKPCRRQDLNALIFKTRHDKYVAAIARIREIHSTGQPILVGTASVDASETLSRMMNRVHIPHVVLNAKNHMKEAEIISHAGEKGAVTISTNMAGRGTDIKLGDGVAELGGLFVLGTEHYESRRIDRQLRGRAARQGDPGVTQFFISLEDDLLRHFGDVEESSRMLEYAEEEPDPTHIPTSATVEQAQRQIEQRNYTWRKHVLDFDDVMNTQREVLYGFRNEILRIDYPQELIPGLIDTVIPQQVADFLFNNEGELDPAQFSIELNAHYRFPLPEELQQPEPGLEKRIADFVMTKLHSDFQQLQEQSDPHFVAYMLRSLILQIIDENWQKHLGNMEELREGVNLRSQGQRNPLLEYKQDAYNLFDNLMKLIHATIVSSALDILHASTSPHFLEQLTAASPDAVESSQE